jgi:hypothetical protein
MPVDLTNNCVDWGIGVIGVGIIQGNHPAWPTLPQIKKSRSLLSRTPLFYSGKYFYYMAITWLRAEPSVATPSRFRGMYYQYPLNPLPFDTNG